MKHIKLHIPVEFAQTLLNDFDSVTDKSAELIAISDVFKDYLKSETTLNNIESLITDNGRIKNKIEIIKNLRKIVNVNFMAESFPDDFTQYDNAGNLRKIIDLKDAKEFVEKYILED